MKSRLSRCLIAPFIRKYKVDASEFEKQNFNTFNDFFTRKLKKEARPIIQDSKKLVFPADARYLAYQKIDQIHAKGKTFSLHELLKDSDLAARYIGGSMLIARLCPVDYHRFHFPSDGVPSSAKLISGHLFSVSPLALKKRLSILWENKRMLTTFETENFGKIAYLEIGATNVGSIRQTYTPFKTVKKGDEKGFFEFGGSCVILLFEPDTIIFDSDLIQNTQNGLETYAKMGESFLKASF